MIEAIPAIINGDTKKMVEKSETAGRQLKNDGLTTSQIRNIFSSVKEMEMKGFNEKELLLLKPKLAYASARPGAKKGTRELKNILTSAIDCVVDGEGNDEKKKERFENFCRFFEAILAYHRAAGGK